MNYSTARDLAKPLAAAFIFCALTIGAATPRAQEMPLFADDRPLKLVMDAPLGTLIRNAPKKMDEYDAVLTLQRPGEPDLALDIKINARGLSRRNPAICKFPPLRVNFKKGQVKDTVFAGNNKLKLVTHCQSTAKFQQYYMQEYLIYRALNRLTPYSFRVRLAEITYNDTDGRRKSTTRMGFFIEDVDDVAARNGLEEESLAKVSSRRLEPDVAAINYLFHFMIGNLDWSTIRGPDPDECCHNTKLLGPIGEAEGSIVPVPYDFDFSGIISAPYATPPEGLPVSNVRRRLYRGFCRHNAQIPDAVALFQSEKDAILQIFGTSSYLNSITQSKSRKYVEGFYAILDDRKKFERQIVKKCRGKKS